MRVNGTEMPLGGNHTLKGFIEGEGYDAGRIAVEKNGEIIPRSRYETEILSENDSLEIITFVGGG